MNYYLGLDSGGTRTKAALFTAGGRELCSASVPGAVLSSRPGHAERDMEELWQSACEVIRRVVEKSGVRPEEVAALGICGHGKGLYLWGRDGRPARPGIVSADSRAYRYPELWRAEGRLELARRRTLQDMLPCHPAALLAWLRDNEPQSFAEIRWVFSCKDYLRFRFTGEAAAELTDSSGSGLLDLCSRRYEPELLELFGLGEIRGALPPLADSGELCGRLSAGAARLCGLLPGTPVSGGMFDIDACALAAGLRGEGELCAVAGTWSINEYLSREPVTDGSAAMNSLYCIPGFYLIEESSPTSAGNAEWFLRRLMPEFAEGCAGSGSSPYEAMNAWVESVPPEEFVPVFLPFVLGSNAHPNARGSFLGLSAAHGREHLLRSLYEGVVFSHRTHIDRLLRGMAEPPALLRLTGGAARSPVWSQMFADAMGLPVEAAAAGEPGALGAAMSAAVAAGEYPSLADAAGAMRPGSARYEPRPELAEIYAEKYALYRGALDCLEPLWDRMQRLVEKSRPAGGQ